MHAEDRSMSEVSYLLDIWSITLPELFISPLPCLPMFSLNSFQPLPVLALKSPASITAYNKMLRMTYGNSFKK